LLKCAKEGLAPTYNLGVMLARTLSYSVAHNYHDTPLMTPKYRRSIVVPFD
jgi:hypothetical protein